MTTQKHTDNVPYGSVYYWNEKDTEETWRGGIKTRGSSECVESSSRHPCLWRRKISAASPYMGRNAGQFWMSVADSYRHNADAGSSLSTAGCTVNSGATLSTADLPFYSL